MAEKDIGIYLTGVATEGDLQADPNLSLGGNRAATIMQSLQATAVVNITGVAVVDVSASSGSGTATVSFTLATNSLSYTAPLDIAGPAVDVSLDGTYELYSGTSSKYMIVTVTSASLPLADQSDNITLSTFADNLFDSVASVEAAAGATEYRALMIRNDSTAAMTSVAVWIDSNTAFIDDSVQIGVELPVAGAVQSVATETTAPATVTFFAAAGELNAIQIGTIPAGGNHGLWVKRVIVPTTQRFANNSFRLIIKADTV